jgi:hypothetical protein
MKEQATFPAPPAPQPSDNLCQRLAAQFPADFVRWAVGVTGAIKYEGLH